MESNEIDQLYTKKQRLNELKLLKKAEDDNAKMFSSTSIIFAGILIVSASINGVSRIANQDWLKSATNPIPPISLIVSGITFMSGLASMRRLQALESLENEINSQ